MQLPTGSISRKCILIKVIVYFFLVINFMCPNLFSNEKSAADYRNEIIILRRSEKFDEAYEKLHEMIAEFPQETKFYSFAVADIAQGFYSQGRIQDAVKLLEKLSKDTPAENKRKTLQARILIRQQKIEEAQKILKQYPSDLDLIDASQFKEWGLDIKTVYNLSAAYALLDNASMASAYLLFALIHRDQDAQKAFQRVEQDKDFDLIRNDSRYVFLKNMIESETFEKAVFLLRQEFEKVDKIVLQFQAQTANQHEALVSIFDSHEKIIKLKTVAPPLIEIQKTLMSCLDQIEAAISKNVPLSQETQNLMKKIKADILQAQSKIPR